MGHCEEEGQGEEEKETNPLEGELREESCVRRDVDSKMCVVSAYDGNLKEMGEYTSRINFNYCERHGYGFRAYTEGFDESRHPAWSKLKFVKETLKDYEWVFWIDADAIFTNHDIRLETFVCPDIEFYICVEDARSMMFNTGAFLIHRCDWAFWFLDELWNRKDWKSYRLWEQTALQLMVSEGRVWDRVKYFPMRAFNSAPTDSDWKEKWYPGDFVAHKFDASMRAKDKLEWLKRCVDVLNEIHARKSL